MLCAGPLTERRRRARTGPAVTASIPPYVCPHVALQMLCFQGLGWVRLVVEAGDAGRVERSWHRLGEHPGLSPMATVRF